MRGSWRVSSRAKASPRPTDAESRVFQYWLFHVAIRSAPQGGAGCCTRGPSAGPPWGRGAPPGFPSVARSRGEPFDLLLAAAPIPRRGSAG
jgi:hypothetical protein